MKSACLPTALALALLAVPALADTIQLADGKKLENVTVVAETWQKVDFKQPRVTAVQSRPTVDVVDIQYSKTTPDYREAQKQLEAGNIMDAAAYLDAVSNDEAVPGHLKANALIQRAEILLDFGAVPEAGRTVDALLKTYPDTRHLARAMMVKGKALLADGQTDAAIAAFAKFKEEVAAKSLGPRWALEAEYNRLFAVEVKGDAKAALDGYTALRQEAESQNVAAVANRCVLRIGRIQIANNKVDEALPLFAQIIDGRFDLPRDLAAAAFLGRGRCFFAKGQAASEASAQAAAKGDKTKSGDLHDTAVEWFKEARLDFLRVTTMYPEVQSQQAEAMFYAGQCFQAVGDTGSDVRAIVLYRTVTSRYPASPWAKSAEAASR